jgi:hypothetical protein
MRLMVNFRLVICNGATLAPLQQAAVQTRRASFHFQRTPGVSLN